MFKAQARPSIHMYGTSLQDQSPPDRYSQLSPHLAWTWDTPSAAGRAFKAQVLPSGTLQKRIYVHICIFASSAMSES